jgi:predicted dehydrogenase
MPETLGVAVIGAGMAGRAHAYGYRLAGSLYGAGLPEVRLVTIADVNEPLARDTARRYGFGRTDTDWRAVAAADDVDVVSVVVANSLHREIVEGLAAAGKHVLCEKPLAPTVADAVAMKQAVDAAGVIGRVGFTFRRSPGVAAIADLVASGTLGVPVHFHGQYWNDYSCDAGAPMSWRYKGLPGSGALADVGSHLTDVSEFLCGAVTSVSGGQMSTRIARRPLPLGHVVGHDHVEVGDEFEPVENDDWATYTARYAGGATGSLSVARIAHGYPNTLKFEIFGSAGSARFDVSRPAEFELAVGGRNFARIEIGGDQPYVRGGMPMDVAGIGFGHNDSFVFQARAFLDEVAGRQEIPPCPDFDHGAHNLGVLDAVVQSADRDGAAVRVDVPVPAR